MIRNLSISFAMLVVLAHSLVPHYHVNELSDKSHQALHNTKDDSIWDRLAFVFHEQTNEGDLECFDLQPEQSFTSVFVDLAPAIFSFPFEFDFEINNERVFSKPSFLIQSTSSKTIDLRGPPQITA